MSEATLAPDAAPPALSPGAQLAAARESRGLTVADIAQQLKLSPWQVEALEADDYRRLPGNVFVRGFLRNYARLVKIDGTLLLSSGECAMPSAAPAAPDMPPSAEIPYPTTRNFNWHKYAIAAIVILIPLVAFEFYRDDTPEVAVKTSQVELPAPQVAAEAAATAAVALQVPATEPPSARTEQKARAAGMAAPPAENVGPARGEQVVHLRFARESWVEIRDRDGRKIFSQLNPPGTEQVVSGLPPLSLIVGNANGVQLTHNEQPVNLVPHTKVDVARLTLE